MLKFIYAFVSSQALIYSENIVVDFNVTGSSGVENFSYGQGVLNIDAGLQFGIINIDDIPQDRFGFIQGDRKIILTLTESFNAQLGNNLVYTHTLTDDQNAWTDPNVNYFCVSDFDNPRSSEPILVKSSSNSGSVDDSSIINDLDSQIAFEDINSEVSVMNINAEQDQADNTQNLEEFKSTVKEWASEPVKVTADGELNEVIGDWSVWIDGEFGEFTLG